MPVERALKVLPRTVQGRLANLHTEWMNGIQFYLKARTPILRGHLSYVDSPWALTSVSQAQFWGERDIARDYGDGAVKDILSVDISDWNSPGMLYKRPARQCSREEIAREVWAQIKAHLEDTGRTQLPNGVMHSFFLDPGITYKRGTTRARNDEPLLVNTKGSWEDRPEAATAIPNLFLASDYVRTNIDLATMEGANESARSAVNALLDRTGSKAERCRKFTLYRPPEFEALKAVDAQRFRAGQPHILDG
jgi:uncharacterized protein with NAD-binding domain and iron-sulfur cluster